MAQTIINTLLPKLGISKKALLLGAGFVCKPTVQILSESGVDVTVACRTLASAEKLCQGTPNTHAISLDVTNESALDEAVAKADVVISLIPYTFHAQVIKSAIRNKKHVVTTSYISPAIQELDKEAREAGITVMNEIGLDPGIDHLSAVKTIDEVHQAGGKILGFYSYCGGLPAPESSDNPLGYRFSWSPRGVLLALRNAAKYYEDDHLVEVPGPELMGKTKPYDSKFTGYNFVAYPNRDSSPYKERYSIPEAKTVIRGTLRYGSFPEYVQLLVAMGFLSEEPQGFLSPDKGASAPLTWAAATQQLIGAASPGEAELISTLEAKMSAHNIEWGSEDRKARLLAGLRWIGIFGEEHIEPRGTPIDTLCATLEKKCQYEEGMRDLVFLQHTFEIEKRDGGRETRKSTLIEYGEPVTATSRSAMAKLVGIPCGLAVLQVLEGKIAEKGVLAPLSPKIVHPLMAELKKFGIDMQDKVVA